MEDFFVYGLRCIKTGCIKTGCMWKGVRKQWYETPQAARVAFHYDWATKQIGLLIDDFVTVKFRLVEVV